MRFIHLILVIIFLLQTTPLTPFVFAKENEKIPSIPLGKNHDKKTYRENEVIIKFKTATTKEYQSIIKGKPHDHEKELSSKNEKIKEKLISDTKITDITINNTVADLGMALITSDEKTTDDLIKDLQKSDIIDYAEPNYIKSYTHTPNDPYFSYQWVHDIDDPDNDTDINTTNAWDIEQSSANQIIVAVIDSGTNYNFSDITENMWDGSSFCLSDTGTSLSCPYHGWDYENDDNDPNDDDGHGTFAASIIGATTNNSVGMAGMSRFNNIKIMSIRFGLDSYSEIQAINFAKNNGAKVINASFTGSDYLQAEKDAIDAFPGIFITAAGNGGSDGIGDNNDTVPLYPCNYSSTNIICVGATDDNGKITTFSNYGENVDISAPGQEVLGVYKDYYAYGTGTSFASPYVAGTAALLYAHKPTASISTIRNTLLQGSTHSSLLSGKIACNRRLSAFDSLNALLSNIIPTETCSKPVYRFWSDKNQGHFYTISEEEKNTVINNYDDFIWRYEGVAFSASNASNVPIYRFWSDKNQHHFYTASIEERDHVINNYDDFIWRYEGIAYYAMPSGKPIYRFWSDKNQSHFYTASIEERDHVINNYDDFIWRYEGIAYYAY